MIFVVLTPGLSIDLETYLGGMLPDLEHFKFETWHYHGSREIFGANWKVAYDGYLEGYHFASLHPNTLLPNFVSAVNHYEAFGPHLRIGFPEHRIRELSRRAREQWWSREHAGYGFVPHAVSNISIALGVGIGQIAQLIPGPTPDRNRPCSTISRRTRHRTKKRALLSMGNAVRARRHKRRGLRPGSQNPEGPGNASVRERCVRQERARQSVLPQMRRPLPQERCRRSLAAPVICHAGNRIPVQRCARCPAGEAGDHRSPLSLLPRLRPG